MNIDVTIVKSDQMAKTSPPIPKQKTTKLQTWITAVSIVVGVVLFGGMTWGAITVYTLLFPQTQNYAKEVAGPIENALISIGAVKKCEFGDPGQGPDNTQPWYEARFLLNRGKTEATDQILRVAKENGYNLNYVQSPTSNIDWYSDNNSRKSSYPELQDGNVTLSASIYSQGSQLGCNATTIEPDASHTAITISVGLSARKQ